MPPVHYDPIDSIEIKAPQHSSDASYLVRYGQVDWDQDGQNVQTAIYVLMKYGEDIKYRRVAHILTTSNTPDEPTDLEKVVHAIQTLKIRNNIR
ncbi:hypothetical protein [Tumebacillus lipolyticus]|uniref:Uncharacterized protein n=1 Tax=Tumebacillus lipolyticus TaxID=1280370 RepID=A0ABW4ZVY1_9BACL